MKIKKMLCLLLCSMTLVLSPINCYYSSINIGEVQAAGLALNPEVWALITEWLYSMAISAGLIGVASNIDWENIIPAEFNDWLEDLNEHYEGNFSSGVIREDDFSFYISNGGYGTTTFTWSQYYLYTRAHVVDGTGALQEGAEVYFEVLEGGGGDPTPSPDPDDGDIIRRVGVSLGFVYMVYRLFNIVGSMNWDNISDGIRDFVEDFVKQSKDIKHNVSSVSGWKFNIPKYYTGLRYENHYYYEVVLSSDTSSNGIEWAGGDDTHLPFVIFAQSPDDVTKYCLYLGILVYSNGAYSYYTNNLLTYMNRYCYYGTDYNFDGIQNGRMQYSLSSLSDKPCVYIPIYYDISVKSSFLLQSDCGFILADTLEDGLDRINRFILTHDPNLFDNYDRDISIKSVNDKYLHDWVDALTGGKVNPDDLIEPAGDIGRLQEITPAELPELYPELYPEYQPEADPAEWPEVYPDYDPETNPHPSPSVQPDPDRVFDSALDSLPDSGEEPGSGSEDIPSDGDFSGLVFSLADYFPFCIPFDLIDAFKLLVAEPTPPRWEYPFHVAVAGIVVDYTFVIDLADFESVAKVFRICETLGFTVGLILVTRHLIRG